MYRRERKKKKSVLRKELRVVLGETSRLDSIRSVIKHVHGLFAHGQGWVDFYSNNRRRMKTL